MICEKCGKKINKTDKFCSNCGTKLNPQHTKEFISEKQSISDINVANGVIDITIYNYDSNSGYETHKKVGIAKKEEIKEWITKTSNPSKIPILLEKLGIEKEESDFMEEIQKVTTIIGDRIMCNSTNVNIVKAILYENDIEYKEEKVNDTTIIYL